MIGSCLSMDTVSAILPATERGRTGLLCMSQGVGQLEHIIAEHVEVALCPRQTSGQGGQDDDPGAGFFREERRKLLAELDFRDDDIDTVFFNCCDQRLKMQSRGFRSRLNLNRSGDLETEMPREIGPGRVVGNESTIRE